MMVKHFVSEFEKSTKLLRMFFRNLFLFILEHDSRTHRYTSLLALI